MKYILMLALGSFVLLGMACSLIGPGQDLNKGASTNVNLELDYEEVIHYDCNNNVTSDKIEVVAPPTQTVTINPINPSTVVDSKFFNTSTGSTASYVEKYTNFVIDHGDGALSMHVITGGNVITYTFYSCPQTNPDGSCAAPEAVQEQGQLVIIVAYTEKTIPTPLKINDCVTPAPTPGSSPVKLNKH